MIPDYTRRWAKGTQYNEPTNEYSADGTCIGVGTIERVSYARACGICYASPIKLPDPIIPDILSLFEIQ
jgi:hypothetical protein